MPPHPAGPPNPLRPPSRASSRGSGGTRGTPWEHVPSRPPSVGSRGGPAPPSRDEVVGIIDQLYQQDPWTAQAAAQHAQAILNTNPDSPAQRAPTVDAWRFWQARDGSAPQGARFDQMPAQAPQGAGLIAPREAELARDQRVGVDGAEFQQRLQQLRAVDPALARAQLPPRQRWSA